MDEQHTQAKLIALLKQDKIQLWTPPFTKETNEAGHEHIQVRSWRYLLENSLTTVCLQLPGLVISYLLSALSS